MSRIFFCGLLLIISCSKDQAAFSQSNRLIYVSALPSECHDGCSLQMITREVGWLRGRSTLWHTENGGRGWRAQQLPPTNSRADYIEVEFADRNLGWLLRPGSQLLYETQNGGIQWTRWALPKIDGIFQAAWFGSDGGRWLGGGLYRHSSTPDAPNYALKKYESGDWGILNPVIFSFARSSKDWREHDPPPCAWVIVNLRFWDDRNGVAVGDTCFYYTETGGEQWRTAVFHDGKSFATNYPLGTSHPVITFLDRAHGWLSIEDGALYYTSDGGKNWFRKVSSNIPYLEAIHFTTLTHGFGIGRGAKLYESTDGGATWDARSIGIRARSFIVLDGKYAWLLSDESLYRFRLSK